jgi:hypothetical protein
VIKIKKDELDFEKYKLNVFNQHKWEYLRKIKYNLYLEKKEKMQDNRNIRSIITIIICGNLLKLSNEEFLKKKTTYMIVRLFFEKFKRRGV